MMEIPNNNFWKIIIKKKDPASRYELDKLLEAVTRSAWQLSEAKLIQLNLR